MLKVIQDGRNATAEEQRILAQYSGWGALAEAFDYSAGGNSSRHENWTEEYAITKELVDKASEILGLNNYDTYYNLRNSARTAFYTSPEIITAMYKIADRLRYKNGNILEPSMGTGNFFGLIPDSMSRSRLYGVELDPITGNIAKLLYPNAAIQIKGYQDTNYPIFFDLAIGNVPFANVRSEIHRSCWKELISINQPLRFYLVKS